MVQTDLAEKKGKKENFGEVKLAAYGGGFPQEKNNVFMGVGCVNQNHNKDTMKGEKITSCIVISSMLQQLQKELLEKGRDLRMLLEVAYPDADAVLVAVIKIKFLLQDQSEDISDQWVTARVIVCDKKKNYLEPSCLLGEYIIVLLHLLGLIFSCIMNFVLLR